MAITEEEYSKEKKILRKTHNLINKNIDELSKEIKNIEDEELEFKKLSWKESSSFDNADLASFKEETSMEESKSQMKKEYYKKLKQIEKKPYFASIVFKSDDGEINNIYISLTYLKDRFMNNILYDWRSPICSLFYDYEVGPCEYEAPGGIIKGELKRKRQYTIQNGKLINIFDNSLNINDEFLQLVLAEDSTDYMKNVVNTIQKEQNTVIRDLDTNNLIVNGIAGSGKTTVALHRIAFLLYRIKNLTSNNILIFSPNNIFTDYIKEVLPSLGEKNTLQTTFDEYMSYQIEEYKEVEKYTDFLKRYYSNQEMNTELVEYKQSDEIIDNIDNFIKDYISKAQFTTNITEGLINKVSKEELNELLNRYNKFPLFERIDSIGEKLSEKFYKGSHKKKPAFIKTLKKSSNFSNSIIDIMKLFYQSDYSKYKLDDKTLKNMFSNDTINYEDALIYTYIKGLLYGFKYEGDIKQVVIDEAQDYNYLQYLIISRIFKKADFTILGDINQNINPYYKYDNLQKIGQVFDGDTKYIELLKTYRSSPEIIAFTNKILKLNHVSAIRKPTDKEVVIRKDTDLKYSLIDDINRLQNIYNSIAIITKDESESNKIYELLKDDTNISIVDNDTKTFNKHLLIIPAYLAKGLEFDSVIVYNDRDNTYRKNERNLLYVACTRAQHELFIYN